VSAPGPTMLRGGQLPAVGAPASIEHLLVGSLLWATPDMAADILALVVGDDFADPQLAVVLAAMREMVTRGESVSPQLVMDRVTRGGVRPLVVTAVRDATTSGAATEACSEYGAAVVAASLRRHTESGGTALTAAADNASESDIPVLAANVAQKLADIARRLAQLRGES
jgi:hypothetical protein